MAYIGARLAATVLVGRTPGAWKRAGVLRPEGWEMEASALTRCRVVRLENRAQVNLLEARPETNKIKKEEERGVVKSHQSDHQE